MIVDINALEEVLRYLKAINKEKLEDIVWMKGNEPLTVTKEQLEEFHFMGLSNRDLPSIIGWFPDDIGIKVTTMTFSKKELTP